MESWELLDLKKFILTIKERPSMFISASEINRLKVIIDRVFGRHLDGTCLNCLRRELTYLDEWLDAEIKLQLNAESNITIIEEEEEDDFFDEDENEELNGNKNAK